MKTFDFKSLLCLIDLKLTINKFGSPKSGNSKVVLICIDCKKEYDRRLYNLKIDRPTICNSCIGIRRWKDPDYRENIVKSTSITSKKMWSSPDYKITASIQSKKIWSSPDLRKKNSEVAQLKWGDPEYRTKMEECSKKLWENEEFRGKNSQRLKQLFKNPDFIGKFSKIMKDAVNSSSFVEKTHEIYNSKAFKEKKSIISKKLWENEEFREKHSSSMKKACNSNVARSRVSQHFKDLWKKSQYRDDQAIIRSRAQSKKSRLEMITSQILSSLNLEYEEQKVIGPWTFDFYVPQKKLFIECQGEYTHSSDKVKARDVAKASYLEKSNPDCGLIYLFEREFLDSNIIRDKLTKRIFGHVDTHIKIKHFDLRDMEIIVLNTREKISRLRYSAPEEFLNSFHYAGYGRSPKRIYGAYLDDKLIAVCKFAPIIRKEVATSMGLEHHMVLELDRFCIHPQYQKKNFASWMISRCSKLIFEEFPKVNCLVSFADSTYGHSGTIYKASNWTELHKTQPDYYYVNQDGWILHKKTLYNHASKMGRTERDYAEEFGYMKMYGKEKTKFILDRKLEK